MQPGPGLEGHHVSERRPRAGALASKLLARALGTACGTLNASQAALAISSSLTWHQQQESGETRVIALGTELVVGTEQGGQVRGRAGEGQQGGGERSRGLKVKPRDLWCWGTAQGRRSTGSLGEGPGQAGQDGVWGLARSDGGTDLLLSRQLLRQSRGVRVDVGTEK